MKNTFEHVALPTNDQTNRKLSKRCASPPVLNLHVTPAQSTRY